MRRRGQEITIIVEPEPEPEPLCEVLVGDVAAEDPTAAPDPFEVEVEPSSDAAEDLETGMVLLGQADVDYLLQVVGADGAPLLTNPNATLDDITAAAAEHDVLELADDPVGVTGVGRDGTQVRVSDPYGQPLNGLDRDEAIEALTTWQQMRTAEQRLFTILAQRWTDIRPGEVVYNERPFVPGWAPTIEVPAGTEWVVEGMHSADPEADLQQGAPEPLPDLHETPMDNARIRLELVDRPDVGLWVTPPEFEANFRHSPSAENMGAGPRKRRPITDEALYDELPGGEGITLEPEPEPGAEPGRGSTSFERPPPSPTGIRGPNPTDPRAPTYTRQDTLPTNYYELETQTGPKKQSEAGPRSAARVVYKDPRGEFIVHAGVHGLDGLNRLAAQFDCADQKPAVRGYYLEVDDPRLAARVDAQRWSPNRSEFVRWMREARRRLRAAAPEQRRHLARRLARQARPDASVLRYIGRRGGHPTDALAAHLGG